MKFSNKKIYLLVILLLVPVMITAQARITKSSPLVVKKLVIVKLESYAKHYRGVCPVTVKMTGKITTPSSMSVEYMFLKSDGSRPKWNSLAFPGAGTKELPFTWTISKNFTGWVQLVVKTGNSERRSDKFHFDVVCNNSVQVGQADLHMKKIIPTVDLSVVDIALSPAKIYSGDELTFFITIKNLSQMEGKQSPPSHLKVKLGFVKHKKWFTLPDQPVPPIPSGKTHTVKIKSKASRPGGWLLRAVADGNEIIREIKEGNNVKSKSFYVNDPN